MMLSWLRCGCGRSVAAGLVAVAFAGPAAAQSYTWTQRSEITARQRSGAAFDSARGRVVLVGGLGVNTSMLEWDGLDWEIVPGAGPNQPQLGNSIAFDEARREVVFYTNG